MPVPRFVEDGEVTPEQEIQARHIARARILTDAVSGPGMSTTITGGELRAIMGRLDTLEAENAALLMAGGSPTAEAFEVVDLSWLSELPVAVNALVEIVEGHPELWGTPAVEALGSYASQRGLKLSEPLRLAVERCLTGDAT